MQKHPLNRHLPRNHFLKGNFLNELEKFKNSYELGNTFSLLEAYQFFEGCSQDHPTVQMPQWIRDGIVKVLKERIVDGRGIKKGVSGNEKSLAMNRAKHFARWNCVNSFCERKMTLNTAFKKTQDYLLGTNIYGSKSAIRRSYYIVREAMKDPEQRLKYLFPNRFNAERLGL